MVLKTGNYENPTNIKAVGIGDGKWAKEEVPGPYCGRTGRPVHLELDLIDDVQRRHELFLLDEGEKKVEHEPETRKSHTIHHSSTTPILTYCCQVSPTPPSSPSTKKTTPWATYSARTSPNTRTSSSPATRSRTRSSPPSSCACRRMGRSVPRRPSSVRVRSSSRSCRCSIRSSPRSGS